MRKSGSEVSEIETDSECNDLVQDCIGEPLGNNIGRVVEKLTCIRSLSQSQKAQGLDGSLEWTQGETKALGCVYSFNHQSLDAGWRETVTKPETRQLIFSGDIPL